MLIPYHDTATLVKVKSSAYANRKEVAESAEVRGTFLQSTDFVRFSGIENIDADAFFYVDPENDFVISHSYRLEGLLLKIALFGADEKESWFKVDSVDVNRDHLLSNQIDNVRLVLSKSKPPNEDHES